MWMLMAFQTRIAKPVWNNPIASKGSLMLIRETTANKFCMAKHSSDKSIFWHSCSKLLRQESSCSPRTNVMTVKHIHDNGAILSRHWSYWVDQHSHESLSRGKRLYEGQFCWVQEGKSADPVKSWSFLPCKKWWKSSSFDNWRSTNLRMQRYTRLCLQILSCFIHFWTIPW